MWKDSELKKMQIEYDKGEIRFWRKLWPIAVIGALTVVFMIALAVFLIIK